MTVDECDMAALSLFAMVIGICIGIGAQSAYAEDPAVLYDDCEPICDKKPIYMALAIVIVIISVAAFLITKKREMKHSNDGDGKATKLDEQDTGS